MLPINTFNHILHEFTDLYMIFINPNINRCSLTQHINYHILNTNNILAQRLNWPTLKNKRPMGLNGRLSIRDFTLTSCQKDSYLYINSPIIE